MTARSGMATPSGVEKLTHLFSGKPVERNVGVQQRPLGTVSDFVVKTLPSRLEQIRAGKLDVQALIDEVERLVEGSVYETQQLADTRVARLDVLMLESSIVHSGGTPGLNLRTLADLLTDSTVQPPAMTYEDIIVNNPPDDPRTFTHGGVGSAEAAFYLGHQLIEGELERAIEKMRQLFVLHSPEVSAHPGDVVALLQAIVQHINIVTEYTHVLGQKMDPGAFLIFRQYLATNEQRNAKGPSGAFTARVPLLEVLFAGETLPEEFFRYLESNRIYFPVAGQLALLSAIAGVHRGETLTQLLGDSEGGCSGTTPEGEQGIAAVPRHAPYCRQAASSRRVYRRGRRNRWRR